MLRMHLQHWATVPTQRHHTCIETIRRQRERRGLVRGLFTAPGTVSGGCSLTYQHNRDMRCCLYHARTALKSRPDAIAWDVLAPLSCDMHRVRRPIIGQSYRWRGGRRWGACSLNTVHTSQLRSASSAHFCPTAAPASSSVFGSERR